MEDRVYNCWPVLRREEEWQSSNAELRRGKSAGRGTTLKQHYEVMSVIFGINT